ncbi:hypothetical protein MPSEU_000995400 [Mayamaea pseudoterrestris]|nr:hypothetical protein MPSEU_000995400 [Mayamaea pseudoterrestris]
MGIPSSLMVKLLFISGAVMTLCNLVLFQKVDIPRREPNVLFPTLNFTSTSCQVLRTVNDIRRCYPSKHVRTLSSACDAVETWQDLQKCLTGPFVPIDKKQNYTVHIVGERNSGTKWLQDELQKCFPRHRYHFKVRRDFIRSKHFFQPIRLGKDKTNSIIVTLYRNPVDWVAAMREAPYHSPRHSLGFDETPERRVVPMPWRSFVETEWTTQRSSFDKKLIQHGRSDETLSGDICAQDFAFHEVMPCRFNLTTDNLSMHQIPVHRFRGYEPIYELRRDQSGLPFRNILDLRRDKIVNFALELPLLVRLGGYVAVRYEDLLRNGTSFVLEEIARILGLNALPAHCRPSPPQPERLYKRVIDPDFRKYVEEHVDFATEHLLGYKE